MSLNRRHKVGLFLTLVIVGAGLLLDVSVKQSIGIGLLGLASTWFVGGVRLNDKKTSAVVASRISGTTAAPPTTEPEFSGGDGQKANGTVVVATRGGSWAWMILSTLVFVALLALSTFNVTWQSLAGEEEKAGESLGRMLIPLIVVGYGARRAWTSLLAKEPEDNPAYKRRHRRFNLIGGVCSVALLVAAIGFGFVTGDRIKKNKRLDAIVSEIAKLGPTSTELRSQIKAILSEETPTFQDYYLRCMKLEGILDQYDLQQQRVNPLLSAMLAEATDEPQLANTLRTIQRINAKDDEVVKLLRLEIMESKELVRLPISQQTSFYRERVVPLEQRATRAADQEIEMMRDAEKAGIKLPSDLQELTKSTQPVR